MQVYQQALAGPPKASALRGILVASTRTPTSRNKRTSARDFCGLRLPTSAAWPLSLSPLNYEKFWTMVKVSNGPSKSVNGRARPHQGIRSASKGGTRRPPNGDLWRNEN